MKILIVDDDAHTRDCLTLHCRRSDELQVVGEAICGKAAIDAANALKPDVMLLDVELRDMSGFEVLRAVGAGIRPLGIMVSSCPDHAIRAFAEGAIDHFVMPVTEERFDLAIARARHQFNSALPGRCSLNFRTERGPWRPNPPRFVVGERQQRLYPLDPQSIDYIEADGKHITLRMGKVEYLSRDSIKRLSEELADLGFVQITRSLLVNAAAVLYAERAGHGVFALTLNSGACLHSSPAYRESISRAILLPGLSKRDAHSWNGRVHHDGGSN